eukprot:Selendium_serpulae@DN601_c0_g1_i1.p1
MRSHQIAFFAVSIASGLLPVCHVIPANAQFRGLNFPQFDNVFAVGGGQLPDIGSLGETLGLGNIGQGGFGQADLPLPDEVLALFAGPQDLFAQDFGGVGALLTDLGATYRQGFGNGFPPSGASSGTVSR